MSSAAPTTALLEQSVVRSHVEHDQDEEAAIRSNATAAKDESGLLKCTEASTKIILIATAAGLGSAMLIFTGAGKYLYVKVPEWCASAYKAFFDHALADADRFLIEVGKFVVVGAVLVIPLTYFLANRASTTTKSNPLMTRAKVIALGALTVGLYFADILSDLGVMLLLYKTGNPIWATESASLLVLQYAIVASRVIAYLRATRGELSWLQVIATVPGVLVMDLLMLLEPFGLLGFLWNEELLMLIPAYKATRIVIEVVAESLPQALLQSYIFRRVMGDGADANYEEHAALLPTSIAISAICILKAWFEFMLGAQRAKMSPPEWGERLWAVGQGLPLDGLRRGTITDYTVDRELTKAERTALVDALADAVAAGFEVRVEVGKLDLKQMGLGAANAARLSIALPSFVTLTDIEYASLRPSARHKLALFGSCQ